jgi:hypothetical protein
MKLAPKIKNFKIDHIGRGLIRKLMFDDFMVMFEHLLK